MNPTISVIVPAFNEEKTIEDVLIRTHLTLESLQFPYEIIVVDDGSTDRTREVASKLKATVLSNGKNRGKGYALKRGFQTAQGDIIITIDADGSHSPEDIKTLLTPILNGADVVLGSRFRDSNGKNSTKKLHLFGNSMINLLIRILTKKHVTDSQSGFRAYKRRILKELHVVSEGYEVETELTVKTLKNGNIIHEVPISSRKRKDGCSHLNPLRDGINILKTILLASIT
ncbi:MAG: glycosyltransferase family 2 protein [Candidatus Bathyarchaeia archaeon]